MDVLVGRGRLRSTVAATVMAGRRGVLLVGPAGVGKSRLAQAAAADARDAGFEVRTVVASAATASLPLAAFAPLLGPAGSRPPDEVLWWAVDGLCRPRGHRPLLLVVDDVHHLDQLSLAVLHQVGSRPVPALLLAARSPEPLPDPVASLWHAGRLERVEVPPLDRDSTEALACAVVGGNVDQVLAARVWELSEGNPLYVRELLLAAVEADAVADIGGRWTMRGTPAAAARLRELILGRVETLDASARDTLDTLALTGALPEAVLSDAVGPDGPTPSRCAGSPSGSTTASGNASGSTTRCTARPSVTSCPTAVDATSSQRLQQRWSGPAHAAAGTNCCSPSGGAPRAATPTRTSSPGPPGRRWTYRTPT
jgi:hypothetical protein